MPAYRIENTKQPAFLKAQLAGYCECCEKEIYEGENVLRDNRFKYADALICLECFFQADKKQLAEMLGATFEEAM